LFDVKAGNEHAGTARKVRPVFPERPVRRVVVPADLDPVDRPASCGRTCLGGRDSAPPRRIPS
jgi:hypothetical protein